MTDKLLAWFGDPALKERVVLKMKEHRAKDEIVRGTYQDFFVYDKELGRDVLTLPTEEGVAPEGSTYKGCAVGCTLPPISQKYDDGDFNWHQEVEKHYGIDSYVAWLIDEIFESQDTFEEAAQFAVDVIEAIPVGADLSWFEETRYGPHSAERFLETLRKAPVPGATESL